MARSLLCTVLFASFLCLWACEADDTPSSPAAPPFEVQEGLDGLSLTYFDQDGAHVVDTLDDIPEANRERVRVDRLDLAPDQRDPDAVWLADLRRLTEGGRYEVERVGRDELDGIIDSMRPEPETLADADIIIYGAEWCGACRSAARYLHSREVPFVERDIEREAGAREEMQDKARAAGIRPSGIPVIDFRGTILTGFDRRRMDQLLAQAPTM